ncbi:MAG: methyltransferase domain-containing protein [Elusimicrobiota bacterium]|jgi:tRNA (cmo5U34)-methyltransferase
MSDSDELRHYFDRVAPDHENLISRLVPYYQKQNSLMMDLIPFKRLDAFKTLDIGSGAGILSRLLLDTFPNATVTAFDLSPVMLDLCKKKLWAYPKRATFQQGDLTRDSWGTGYDVVFAGLVLHHTDDQGKRNFFRRLIATMNPGGILLCRDIVRGRTERLTQQYEQLWKLYMRAQGEDGASWYEKFRAKDVPATAEDQVKWIREAGFQDVGCHWRYLNFAVTGGTKPT